MFKNLKLGQKIGMGFTILIIIALFLGGLAVISMKGVQSGASKLAKDYVPSVAVATNVERYSLLTMYDIRGYTYTEDETYLNNGKEKLAEVKKYLTEATSLAEKSKNLETLKKNAANATLKVTEYENLLNETIAVTNDIKKDRESMELAAGDYMKQCNDFLSATKDVKKIAIVNKIIDVGNSIIITSWKASGVERPKTCN